MSSLNKLLELVMNGLNTEAVIMAKELLAAGISEEEVINEGLTKALEALDDKCGPANFNLVEILLAGRAMTDVLNQVIVPRFANRELPGRSRHLTVILGTIEGDVHDLGVRVVSSILTAAGLRVIDLGKDVQPEQFVSAAVKEDASFIGVSSLLTVCIPHIRKIKELLNQQGLEHVEVLAGGAALSRVSADYLNVDFVASHAMAAWNYIKQKTEGGGKNVE